MAKNITFPRGSRVTLRFRRVPPSALPGSTIHFTVARARNSTTKIIDTANCSAPDSQGVFSHVIPASDTDVEPGRYFWDARIVDAGQETLIESGICMITGIAELP